ncbi:MAG TPA: YbgF trimerization domain-containing protein, partial [Gammaproteobacteria bacterium]|nr:YbgF trimerization domain-containing protein [Gammaproteobacteria bacterium]
MRFTTLAISTLVAMVIMPNVSWARSQIDARVTKLENIVEGEINAKLLKEMEAMQQEIRELRGKLEEQQNSVQKLDQKQEKLYLNLDSRLNTISEPKPADQTVQDTIPNTEAAFAEVLPQPAAPAAATVDQPAPAEVLPGANEKALFDAAHVLLRNQQYAAAIIEFKDLLWQFPEGVYASQAYFWLGEMYLLQWQQNKSDKTALNNAKESFTTLSSKYQGQPCEGDALLKLALIEMDQDHFAVAKDIFKQVISKFPNTARARIAETKLVHMDNVRIHDP